MLEREQIIENLWRRLSTVEGVAYTARNPKAEPNSENMPCIQFFELSDKVVHTSQRGGYPIYKRSFQVVIELFVKASSDSASSKALGSFMEKLKRSLYEGGPSLGGLCSFSEDGTSQMIRPPTGDNIIGTGMGITILYVEDAGKLFT